MQNHPHDSICGCSVDAVNDEMKTRFDKSRQVAETVTEESAKYLADQIDTENAGRPSFYCLQSQRLGAQRPRGSHS